MKTLRLLVLKVCTLAACAHGAVSFREEIAPVLLEHCQTCHGPAEQRGGYRVDTFDFLARNEDPAEPVLSPGKPEKSSLYQLLLAADAQDRMPQKAPPLPADRIAKIKLWIEEGARFDGPDRAAPLVEIVPAKTHPPAPVTYAAPLPVTALAFTPDGRELLIGGLREILVRDAASGELKRRISNAPPRTFDIAFHPDGQSFVATGGAPGESGEARHYGLQNGALIAQLAAASDTFLDAEFLPDGKSLLLGGADHSLSKVDVATGKRTRRWNAHSDAVTGLAVSPDGERFASVGLDRIAKVFETDSGKLQATYREHQNGLYSIGFLPDNELFSSGKDAMLHVWGAAELKKKREWKGTGAVLRTLVAGKSFFAAGASGKLEEVSADTLKAVRTFEGLSDWIYAVAVHPQSQRIAAGCFDGSIAVWDLANGSLVLSMAAFPMAE